MKGKKYTIKDIAELAGVSKGTVDRVLHNRGKVSQKALDAINNILKEIDYQPNLIARNLKNNKIYHICVLVPDPNKDAYWKPCIEGIHQAQLEFKSLGIFIETFYFIPNSTESFLEINNDILKQSPDAVLLTSLFQKETLKVIKKYDASGILVSTFNDQINSSEGISFVGQDLFRSGSVAAHLMHMITRKKTEFAIIHIDETFNNSIHLQDKEKGFRNYFDIRTKQETKIYTLNVKQENLNKEIAVFLDVHPDIKGLFVTTSKVFKVAQTIQNSETNDLKIIGYDLLDENIKYLNEGKIDFLIHQNPKQQTLIGITHLTEHFLFNKVIPIQKFLPIDIITSENVSSYLEN